MGLSIQLVFPDGEKEAILSVSYSTFAALRAVVKFSETLATATLPGAALFHQHSDCDGEWSTDDLQAVAAYLEAVLNDTTRKPQRSRDQIIGRMQAEEQASLQQLRHMLFGNREETVVMYPGTYPRAPVADERSDHEGDEDDVVGPAQLAIPPTLHSAKMCDFDDLVAEIARDLKNGAERKAKAVFC
jgi:hypothetical protein